MNLSSRIENLTKFYSCPILISQTTFNELQNEIEDSTFLIREVDTVIVKGKTTSIKIYEVLCFNNETEKKKMVELKTEFENGLRFYKQLSFEKAILHFKNLEKDLLSEMYIKRCKNFMNHPPSENWDGSFILESK